MNCENCSNLSFKTGDIVKVVGNDTEFTNMVGKVDRVTHGADITFPYMVQFDTPNHEMFMEGELELYNKTYYDVIRGFSIEELASIIDCPNNIDEIYDASKYCDYEPESVEESIDMCIECRIEFLNSEISKDSTFNKEEVRNAK